MSCGWMVEAEGLSLMVLWLFEILNIITGTINGISCRDHKVQLRSSR